MELLIGAGTDVNALNHKEHSPLQLAIAKPSKRCVAALLQHESCDVNLQVRLHVLSWLLVGGMVQR